MNHPHAYLLKIPIRHNKKQIPLINLLINCISAISAPQILSITGESTFLSLNFLMFGLCISSANSLFEIFSFLTAALFASVAAPPEVFYQKICKPSKKVHIDIHRIWYF